MAPKDLWSSLHHGGYSLLVSALLGVSSFGALARNLRPIETLDVVAGFLGSGPAQSALVTAASWVTARSAFVSGVGWLMYCIGLLATGGDEAYRLRAPVTYWLGVILLAQVLGPGAFWWGVWGVLGRTLLAAWFGWVRWRRQREGSREWLAIWAAFGLAALEAPLVVGGRLFGLASRSDVV